MTASPLQSPFSSDDIDAVFFDLDGTLMATDDEAVGFWELRRARARMRRERASPLLRLLLTLSESPLKLAFALTDFFGLEGLLVRLIAEFPFTRKAGLFPPVADVDQLIDSLNGRYQLAVVSNRSRDEVHSFLMESGIDGKVEVIVGRDSTWRVKPHPKPLWHAAERLGVPIERCLMVGDTSIDIQAARRAGAWAVGVLCGFGQRPELERAGAHLVVQHTRQVAALLMVQHIIG